MREIALEQIRVERRCGEDQAVAFVVTQVDDDQPRLAIQRAFVEQSRAATVCELVAAGVAGVLARDAIGNAWTSTSPAAVAWVAASAACRASPVTSVDEVSRPELRPAASLSPPAVASPGDAVRAALSAPASRVPARLRSATPARRTRARESHHCARTRRAVDCALRSVRRDRRRSRATRSVCAIPPRRYADARRARACCGQDR